MNFCNEDYGMNACSKDYGKNMPALHCSDDCLDAWSPAGTNNLIHQLLEQFTNLLRKKWNYVESPSTAAAFTQPSQ